MGTFHEASPRVILHSFSVGRSITGVSTGSRGRVGTRWRILEVSAAPCSPGTLAPSVITVDTKVLIDLRKSSASAISDDLLLDLPFPMRLLDTESWCSARAQ